MGVLINPLVSICLSLVFTAVFIGTLVALGSMAYLHKPLFLLLQDNLGIRADYFIVPYMVIVMLLIYLVANIALVVFGSPIEIRHQRREADKEIPIKEQWNIYLWGAWYGEKLFFWYHLKYYFLWLSVYSVLVLIFHTIGAVNIFELIPSNINFQVVFVLISGVYMILSGVSLKSYLYDKYEFNDIE